MGGPNVLLIVLDTARADAFEPYGAATGSTPAVAELAGRGTVVEQAYAPSGWTLPTHAAMLSGQLPRAIGLGQAPGETTHSVRPVMEGLREGLLPTALGRAGYETAGASCNLWVSPTTGFDTGFDEFTYHPSPRAETYNQRGVRARLRWRYEGAVARFDDGARAVHRHMRAWFDRRGSHRPFFWFVNLNECHSPYLPPRPYNDLPVRDRIRAAGDVKRFQTLRSVWRNCLGAFSIPPEALARMRHLYIRSVRLADDWLARTLNLLDSQGVLDDTLVVVTSDHGENFGEGGLCGHAFSLDQRLIHVPLITAGPNNPEVPQPFSLVDLPWMLAQAVGLEDHPWSPPVGERAVVAQFDPLVARDDPRLARLVRAWNLDERGARMLSEPLTCATDGRFKLVRHGTREVSFDLHRDPLEVAATELTEDTDHLRRALDDARVWATPETTAGGVRGGQDPDTTADADEVDRLEDQMRLLGYM